MSEYIRKHALGSYSRKELLNELLRRESETLKNAEDTELPNIDSYMNELHKAFKPFWSLNAVNLLSIPYAAGSIRSIAVLTNKLCTSKNLNKGVEGVVKCIDLHSNYSSIEDYAYYNKTIANSLAAQSLRYLKAAFKQDDFHVSVVQLYDAADILALAVTIGKEDLKEAKKLSYLDTVVREGMSDKAWNWIQKHLR